MIRFLDFLSFALDLGYVVVFFELLRTFLPLRQNWLCWAAAFFSCNYLALTVIYSNDLANLLGALVWFAAHTALFYRGRWVEKLTAVLVFYPAFVAVNYLTLDTGSRLFFTLSGASSEQHLDWGRETLLFSTAIHTVSLAARLLFWLGAWLFLRRHLGRITASLTTRMWLVVDALMLAPFVAIFTIVYFMPEQMLIVYPICITSIFSSFGCVYLAAYICDSVKTAYRAQELELQKNYYMDKIRDEERVRRIYHDMKNHLLVLQAQAGGAPQAAGMLETLQAQIADYENYYHTGNDFLDVILRDKARAAKERQIDFSAAIQLQGSGFLDPLDISTLFGNALDNAIEASEKLPPEMRLITVKASRIRDMLVITVENNMPAGSPFTGKSTKKDPLMHGFGLSNIQKAAGRYGGQCTAGPQGGRFLLKIMIPVPE